MVICVAAFERDTYSQTFVRNHIQHLPAKVVPLYLAEMPSKRIPFIEKFLTENKIELVLAEFGKIGVLLSRACHSTRIPLVVLFAGEDAYSRAPKWSKIRAQYPTLFGIAAAVIAVSHDMEGRLLEIGVARSKLRYCHFGVDTNLFHGANPAQSPPLFLAVGRFVDKKAPDLTIIAFSKVLKFFPAARLVMVGSGELMETCERIVHALEIREFVEFAGVQSPAAVASLMRSARCFVQHSICAKDGNCEGTPNTVIEAGASGLPVVASRHTGISDVIIHEETGLLFPERDVDTMVQYMLCMAADPNEASRLGAGAKTRIQRYFSLESSIDSLWRILTEAHST